MTVRGKGRGGRNVEFLLSLAIALDGHARIHGIAGDTDGVDGQEEIAGAVIAPDTLARAWARACGPRTCWTTTTPTVFPGARRLGDHGSDADQRQRLSRDIDRGGSLRRSRASPESRRLQRCFWNRGSDSRIEQGRWRLSSCRLMNLSQPSRQAPFEPGRT